MYIYTYIRSRQFLRLRNQTEGKEKERKRCVLYQNPSREKKGARKRGGKKGHWFSPIIEEERSRLHRFESDSVFFLLLLLLGKCTVRAVRAEMSRN